MPKRFPKTSPSPFADRSCGEGSERGVAILELAFALPFLLMVIFCSAEIKRYISAMQNAQVLSRETASMSFRSCADFFEPEGQFSNVNLDRSRRCLVDILGTPSIIPGVLSVAPIQATAPGIQTFSNNLFGANFSSIVVSLFRYDDLGDGDPTTGVLREMAKVGEYVDASQNIDRRSRFQIVGNTLVGKITLNEAFFQSQERVVVVEVFSDYRPILGFVPIFGRMIPQEVYEVAIL